jgi:hypothetical protein
MLEYCRIQRSLDRCPAQRFRLGDERRHSRGQVFVVETWRSEAFYEQSVSTEYQNRIDSRTLAEGAREIPDVRHGGGESAKLGFTTIEVKRPIA